MATTDNISTIALQAVLDKAKSVKNINKDIAKMEGQLKPLEIQVKADAKSLQSLHSVKKDLEKLFGDISKIISGNISSQMSGELKKAESSTGSSLSSILKLWGAFGTAVEKILPSAGPVSGFNNLTGLISGLHDATKGALGSLGTVGLGAGLFSGLQNTGKRRVSARISNA
ncbi:MAG: hypothetical protein NC429_16555 [Lachnospiraceae bacterium]|nr:hypothetical protein [Lachnospiraceae bacterium]